MAYDPLMPRRLQPYLAPQFKPRLEHGGAIRRGRRKLARPMDPKRPLHIVMRALQARGPRSMLTRANSQKVDALVHRYARQFQVRIFNYSNVGNHLHLLVQGKHRRQLQAFLRVLPGQLAQALTGAKKGRKLASRFWDLLAFSRVVEWGRSLQILRRYIAKNDLEAAGIVSREEIERIFRVPGVGLRD